MSATGRGLRGVDGRSGRGGLVRRGAPIVVGLGLISGAVWVVVDRRDAIGEGLSHAAGSPWWAITLIVLFPILSIVMTSCSLWLLTRRFGRVGFGEMNALVCGATLLNYLPMRPGLLGRLAYHKRVNGIAVRDSVRVLVEAVALSVFAAGLLLGLGLLDGMVRAQETGVSGGVGLDIGLLLVPVVVLGTAAAVLGVRHRGSAWCGVLAAAGVRYLDMLIWTGRYALLLWVLGTPVRLEVAVIIASLSQIAMLAPTGGGGFGVREWTVGLLGGSLGASLETALVADLINRAAELLVAVPMGLVGMGMVRKNLRLREPHELREPREPDKTPPTSDG
ncbi:MAG: uncharacterized membrane protein YbhN (UPF0104 family) [Phycisphaerales bacterium]|jgi:uncharacterized membrane protein YbhN (UPF0104 family)